MTIKINHQLQEQIPHDAAAFPVTFYCDELASLPSHAGLLHWHPYFEIATAKSGVIDYQVGQNHIILEPGDSIFVNSNVLHEIRQVSGDTPDPMPNIVFSGTVSIRTYNDGGFAGNSFCPVCGNFDFCCVLCDR